MVDDAAVAFHDKTINKSIEVGDEVRATAIAYYGMKGVLIEIDNTLSFPYVVNFGEGLTCVFSETELEKVNDGA